MRRFVLPFGVLTPAAALSQSLGTKPDMGKQAVSGNVPLVNPFDMIQMVLALVIVGALLKWVLPKAVSKFGKRLSTPFDSAIKVEESAAFGAGQLQVVTVYDRKLLLCVTAQSVSCIADLTPPAAAAPEPQPVFMDVLSAADPANALVSEDPAETGEMSMDEAIRLIESAKTRIQRESDPLKRLDRLTGGQ